MVLSSLQAFLQTQEAFQDDKTERLRFLYSHFSYRRDSNPAGFRGAVAFWQSLITSIAAQGLQKGERDVTGADHLVLHADDGLLDRLKWKEVGKPGDVGTVLSDLAQARAILPLEAFLSSPKSVYSSSWPSWLVSTLVGKPLSWTFRQLGLGNEEGVSPESAWKRSRGDWVVLKTVEEAADRIAERLDSTAALTDRLFTPVSFREAFAMHALPDVTLTELDIKVLLRYLARDRRLLVVEKEAIKVLAEDEQPAISEAERGILKVVEGVNMLQSLVDSLEKRVAECSSKAASYVRSGNKEGARAALRTCALLNNTLSERTGQLENLTAIKLRIDSAASDAAVLLAYESATKALKGLTPDRDRVDKVTDDLSEAMADQKELSEAIDAIGADRAVDIDEDELEAELAQLADQRKREQESAEVRPVPQKEQHAQPVASQPAVAETQDHGAVTEGQDKEQRQAVAAE